MTTGTRKRIGQVKTPGGAVAPHEKWVTRAALLHVSRHPLIVWLNFEAEHRMSTKSPAARKFKRQAIEARADEYRKRIEAKPVCAVVWETQVEARFTKGGKYAPSGTEGQSDLFALIRPTGRALFLEGKRDTRQAKQSPLQVTFEGIATACGCTYGVYRTPAELLEIIERELGRAQDALT